MLKHLARSALQRSGAFELVRRLNENNVRILMYHRFPERHSASFDRQCAFLAAKYTVLPLHEAARRLEHGEPVTNVAVMTIDDGYADVHEVAFPILRKHRLPATLFVTTGFVRRACWMPGDRVKHYFATTSSPTVKVTDDANHVYAFSTSEGRASEELRTLLKRVPERTKRRILSDLDGDLPVPEEVALTPQYKPCTWDQLRELAANGFSIGAHTVTHPILARIEEPADTEQEILQSKAEIEQELQRPVDVFAYPNGLREDIDQVSVDCVRANFKAAVTAIPGMNPPGSDLHELLRLSCDPDFSVSQMARLMAGPVRRRPTPANAAHAR